MVVVDTKRTKCSTAKCIYRRIARRQSMWSWVSNRSRPPKMPHQNGTSAPIRRTATTWRVEGRLIMHSLARCSRHAQLLAEIIHSYHQDSRMANSLRNTSMKEWCIRQVRSSSTTSRKKSLVKAEITCLTIKTTSIRVWDRKLHSDRKRCNVRPKNKLTRLSTFKWTSLSL